MYRESGSRCAEASAPHPYNRECADSRAVQHTFGRPHTACWPADSWPQGTVHQGCRTFPAAQSNPCAPAKQPPRHTPVPPWLSAHCLPLPDSRHHNIARLMCLHPDTRKPLRTSLQQKGSVRFPQLFRLRCNTGHRLDPWHRCNLQGIQRAVLLPPFCLPLLPCPPRHNRKP